MRVLVEKIPGHLGSWPFGGGIAAERVQGRFSGYDAKAVVEALDIGENLETSRSYGLAAGLGVSGSVKSNAIVAQLDAPSEAN